MNHRHFILVTILVSARAAGFQGYTKQFKGSLTWNKTALWNYPQQAPGFSLKPQPEHYQLLLFHKVKTVSSRQCVMAQLNICTGKLFHQISWQPCMDFTPQMDLASHILNMMESTWRKRKGWKSTLDACDFQVLRRHLLKKGVILSWKSLHGLTNTSRNYCQWKQVTVPSTNAS